MQPIYVEASDEVTTVIERIAGSTTDAIALVVPRGAILLQSIVNLKLVKKSADDHSRSLAIITTDKIGRNLATQLGITTYAKFDANAELPVEESAEVSDGNEPKVIAGVPIHRYYDEEEVVEDEEPVTPIVPKALYSEQPADQPLARRSVEAIEDAPITVRSLATDPEQTPIGDSTGVTAAASAHEPATEEVNALATAATAAAVNDTDSDKRAEVVPEAHRSKAHSRPERRRLPWRKIGFFVAYLLFLALIAGGAIAYVYLPQTTVTVHVPSQAWETNEVVVARPDIAAATVEANGNLAVPATVTTKEGNGTLTVNATGTKTIGTAAKGSATIYNGYSSNPVTLPAGARLLANNIGFTTDAAVTVPGARVENGKPVAGSVNVAVTAEQIGPSSNLSNVTGSIVSPTSNTYAQITETTGGSSQEVKVITQADLSSGREALSAQIQTDLTTQMGNADDDAILPAGSDRFTLATFTSTVQAGAEAASADLQGTGRLERLSVSRASVRSAVEAKMKQTAGSAAVPVTGTVVEQAVTRGEENTVHFNVTATGSTRPVVETGNFASKLAGKTTTAGNAVITASVPSATVNLTRTPGWWPFHRYPTAARSITVRVQYE